jgi:NADH-quinone oxidoreductase subunit C
MSPASPPALILHDRLTAAFPTAGLTFEDGRIPATIVPVESLVSLCAFLKSDRNLGFDYPHSITAIDYMDFFEVVYQVRSLHKQQDITVKCRIDRDVASAPSVVAVWAGANLQEREIYDLMGITFTGHPDMTRVLLWDEFDGHPLRKDFGIPAPLPPEIQSARQAT